MKILYFKTIELSNLELTFFNSRNSKVVSISDAEQLKETLKNPNYFKAIDDSHKQERKSLKNPEVTSLLEEKLKLKDKNIFLSDMMTSIGAVNPPGPVHFHGARKLVLPHQTRKSDKYLQI